MVKNLLINTFIILLSFIVGIILLEGAVRVFHLESDLFLTLDTCVGFKNTPNKKGYHVKPDFKTYIEINNQGFRDVDHVIKKEGDVYRIVMLGDSFTEGSQVPLEDTFSKRLERLLIKDGRDAEVISLGVSSYGTNNALLSLECFGLLYEPDLVVLNFFAGNDVDNNYFTTDLFSPTFRLKNDKLVLDSEYRSNIEQRLKGEDGTIYFKTLKFIKDHSFFARLIRNKVEIIRTGSGSDAVRHSKVFNRVYDDEIEEAWLLTQALIMRIAETSFENNADFLLVQIPAHSEYKKSREDLKTNEKFDFDKPRQILNGFADENNIQHVDLLPLFENVAGVSFEDVSWPHDGHFNKKGNELTSQFIHDTIKNTF